jgi:CBS-domain-containing membrane protein
MEMQRIEDVMIPLDRYPHLPYWFTLRQAMVEIQQTPFEVEGIESLPRAVLVFDKEYRLVGYARRRDIMHGLEPRFMILDQAEGHTMFGMKVDPELSELGYSGVGKSIQENAEKPIADIMRPIKCTIEAEDHLLKAISELVEQDQCLIPVLKDGKVVGVINTVVVFHELAKFIV